MGDQALIEKWINESLKKHPKYINPGHIKAMGLIYKTLCDKYEKPVKMELLSVSRTYKLIYNDRIEKATIGSDTRVKMQSILHDNKLNVPKIKTFMPCPLSGGGLLKIDEWIEGDCLRNAIIKPEIVAGIKPKYWHKLGELIAGISAHKGQGHWITVCDIHWGNYVIDYKNDKVWLIDCKKLLEHPFPEKWIYEKLLFDPCISSEQIKALAEGYASVKRKSDEVRGKILKHIKIFTETIYE